MEGGGAGADMGSNTGGIQKQYGAAPNGNLMKRRWALSGEQANLGKAVGADTRRILLF